MNLLTRTPSRFISISFLIFALSGCGGGGGGGNSSPTPITSSPSSIAITTSAASSKSASSLANSATPKLNTFGPDKAIVDQLTTFTFEGSNLTSGINFTLDGCIGTLELAGGTDTLRQFSCTPKTSGLINGQIKLTINGTSLGNFEVTVSEPTKTDPVLNSLSPLTITYSYGSTVFTLEGSDLENGMIFKMDDCTLPQEIQGGTSTKRLFTCGNVTDSPFQAGSEKNVTITDGVTGKLLGSYVVNVVGAPEFTTPLVSSTSPLSANVGERATFTFEGTNFHTRSTTTYLENCNDTNVLILTSTSLSFSCIPMEAGLKKGSAGGFDFEVNVMGQTPTTSSVVTSISPSTAYIHEWTTFTIIGQGLENVTPSCRNYREDLIQSTLELALPTTQTSTRIEFQCKFNDFGSNFVKVVNGAYPYLGINTFVPIQVVAAPDNYRSTYITSDIYTAGQLQLNTPKEVKGDGTYYYKINLTAGEMYSFDAGLESAILKLYDRAGNSAGPSFGSHYGWTPTASGTYYLSGPTGSVLTVKGMGLGYSDPGIHWLAAVENWTFGDPVRPTTLTGKINIYKGETYTFELYMNSYKAKTFTLVNENGDQFFSVTLNNKSRTTKTFTATTSGTYTMQVFSVSDPGAIVNIKSKYSFDTDHDGDPDSTDPFPFDPTRNSSTGSGNGGGGGNTDLSACDKPYTGDSSDPQIYTWDWIAQFDQCAYRATKNEDYVTDGNRQCKVLDGWLKSLTGNTFKPQYCNGPLLIK